MDSCIASGLDGFTNVWNGRLRHKVTKSWGRLQTAKQQPTSSH